MGVLVKLYIVEIANFSKDIVKVRKRLKTCFVHTPQLGSLGQHSQMYVLKDHNNGIKKSNGSKGIQSSILVLWTV